MPLLTLHIRSPLLLAQIDNWRRLGERFSGEHLEWGPEDFLGIAALVLGIAGVFFVLRKLAAWQERRDDQPPKQLFREVADVHRLGFFQRRTCREVARSESLEDPAELFVRPDLRATLAARDASLAGRLFGGG